MKNEPGIIALEPAGESTGLSGADWPSAVLGFARALSVQDEWPGLLREGLRQLIEVFDLAEAGAVFVYRRGPDRLRAAAALGYSGEAILELRLKKGESMVGEVFAAAEPRLYACPADVSSARSRASPANRELLRRLHEGVEHPQCAYCLPLLGTDGAFGVVLLENWTPQNTFAEGDLRLAEGLGRLLGTAADCFYLRRRLQDGQQVMDRASGLEVEIMSALSHDMRTPLASIKGYATALLLDEVQWDAETARDYLQVVVQECDHLSEIIADLLETAVIDSGRLEIEREPVLLTHLTRDVIEEMRRRSDQHRFVVHFDTGFPVVEADGGRIRRVLFNLLDNAIKYSPGGGLIVVRGAYNDDEVTVSVSDQGEGIAPEHLNRLFERFFRVQFVNGKHVVGTGLGLPIARAIIELHGGHIWAESTMGEGSTLYFTLPLLEDQAAE